jgi:DNA-binding transcriptional ArsR family regulator
VWPWFYWGFLVLCLANTALAAVAVLRPWWSTRRAILRLTTDFVGGVLFCWLLQAQVVTGLSIEGVGGGAGVGDRSGNRRSAGEASGTQVRGKYALTRIYRSGYTNRVESAFGIIAEPNRRAILSLLVSSEQSVGEIERQLRMPQPTVSKHLRVLREAGFVEATVDGQRRLYRLRPEPFQEVDAWLAPFRRFWSAHVDALERHLDRLNPPTPTGRKPPKKRRRRKGETK